MKSLIKLYLVILGSLMLSSCEKLLDLENVSDITNDDYWETQGDVESYLFGIYANYRNLVNTTTHFEDRGDTFVPGMEGGASNAWNHNLTPQNAPNWGSFYTVIQHCNLLITYSEGVPFNDQATKNTLLAEAYFIRAHSYFSLLRIWGDVPLEIVPTENDVKEKLPRASQQEVMQQVLSDVDQAIALFPEQSNYDKNRASKSAASALKADALLWKVKVLEGTSAELEEVVTQADLASQGATLEDDFAKIYDQENKKGKEVIFALHFHRDEQGNHYSDRLKPRDIFVQDAVNREDIAYARSGARSQYAPSPKLQDAFLENPSDIRTAHSYVTAITAQEKVIGVFDNKMRGSVNAGNRYYDDDLIVYRLAEMILFKAEAFAALGKTEDAIAELNKIRERAEIGPYSGANTKQAVEKAILQERFREFYLELKRWPDLIRYHHAGTIDVYQQVPNLVGKSVPLFSPIPQTEIDRNTLLEQTNGY